MDIKNNIKTIKEDFKGDEKMLENAFRLERLYKKYKYLLFGVVIILIIWFGYYNFSKYQTNKHAQKVTEIYNELLKNPLNQTLLDDLKKNAKDLYDLYMYAQALQDGNKSILKDLRDSKEPIVADLASYQFASYDENLEDLQKSDTTPMKDFAILQEAYLLYKQNKITEGKALLEQIPKDSPLFQIATILRHYDVSTNAQNTAKNKSIEVKSVK